MLKRHTDSLDGRCTASHCTPRGPCVDTLIRTQVVHNLSASKFFCEGWGDVSRLDTRRFARLMHGVQRRPTEHLTVRWGTRTQRKTRAGLEYERVEGTLEYLPPGLRAHVDSIPAACERGRVWLVRPGGSECGPAGMTACVVQLAATGEQGSECDPAGRGMHRHAAMLHKTLSRALPVRYVVCITARQRPATLQSAGGPNARSPPAWHRHPDPGEPLLRRPPAAAAGARQAAARDGPYQAGRTHHCGGAVARPHAARRGRIQGAAVENLLRLPRTQS